MRHAERSLDLWRGANWGEEKFTWKRMEQVDTVRSRTQRQDGATHVHKLKVPLRKRAQTKRTSAEQVQRRDAKQMWTDVYR